MIGHFVEYSLSEILQGNRLRQTTHTPQADRMRGVCIVNRHEWFLVDESEVVGRRLSHAAIRSVGISVPYPQPAAVLVESADDVAPETESARLVYGTEEQRVMGDEQVRASSDGLVNDGGGRVGGEHDAVHVVTQIADNEARLIPFLGVAQWVQGLENVDDLLEIRHMSHCSGLLLQGTHSAIADKPCSCSSLLDYRLAFAYKQSTGLFAQRLSPLTRGELEIVSVQRVASRNRCRTIRPAARQGRRRVPWRCAPVR